MKVVLLGLLGNIAIFLLFAFACWQLNPNEKIVNAIERGVLRNNGDVQRCYRLDK